jgi:hypothetical protein
MKRFGALKDEIVNGSNSYIDFIPKLSPSEEKNMFWSHQVSWVCQKFRNVVVILSLCPLLSILQCSSHSEAAKTCHFITPHEPNQSACTTAEFLKPGTNQ